MISIKKCSTLLKANWCRLLQPHSRDAVAKRSGRAKPGVAVRYLPAVILSLIAVLLVAIAHAAPRSCRSYLNRTMIRLQGGCIAPSAPNENIRLDVMHVTIRCKRDSYSVDAVYHLFNTGKAATVTVGVPKFGRLADHPDCVDPDNPEICDFLGFDAWVNGRKTEFSEVRHFFTDQAARPIEGYCNDLVPGCASQKTSETRWMTKKVTFPGNALTTIRVWYQAFYNVKVVISGLPDEMALYDFSMGRYWKGKIRKATFIYDKTDVRRADCRKGDHKNAVWAWQIHEFEPSPEYYRTLYGDFRVAVWRKENDRNFAPTPCIEQQ